MLAAVSEDVHSPFAHVLHPETVRLLSDSRSYERGREYFESGRVSPPLRSGTRIECRVRGNSEYDVALWIKGDALAYSCTCPHALEGAFCKHCVACALAWLAQNAPQNPLAPSTRALALVERFLAQQDKDWLVRFVLEHAAHDSQLLAKLLAYARRR